VKRRIFALAAGIMIAAGGLVALSTTTASAATPCVDQEFGIWDTNTYYTCVNYEQVLLNDLSRVPGGGAFVNQVLATDGYYGPLTTSDVEYFQSHSELGISVDGITGPQTWMALCEWDWYYGWTGAYWQAVGCPNLAE
jgi:peptidoglycan hydrolase-like protein with peptidoglycan-binding domain